jgi:hypothetical protein
VRIIGITKGTSDWKEGYALLTRVLNRRQHRRVDCPTHSIPSPSLSLPLPLRFAGGADGISATAATAGAAALSPAGVVCVVVVVCVCVCVCECACVRVSVRVSVRAGVYGLREGHPHAQAYLPGTGTTKPQGKGQR